MSEITFTDAEIEEARAQRRIEQEQQYKIRREQDIKVEKQCSNIDKARIKKLVFFVLLPLGAIGIIGIALGAAGALIPSTVLVIIGSVVAAIGFVPFLIITLIIAYKRGIMW